MSLTERENSDEPDFSWGKKFRVGGKKKDLRFYESFTFDGVEYTLHDSVYLYNKQDEDHPFIGKLIKIWQCADKSKRVRVQWFFRVSEISYWLRTHNVNASENELFFAAGEGVGLSNVNPLEAIVGKCSVVCISRDSRNPQPSAEQLQMADYVFYRTFDVGKFIISDKMDERIGGLEVKYLFNKQVNEMIIDQTGFKSKEEDNRIAVVFEEPLQLSDKPFDGCEEEQVQDSREPSHEVNVANNPVSANEAKVQELLESDTHNLGGRPSEKVKPDEKAIVSKEKATMQGEHTTLSQDNVKISNASSKGKRKHEAPKDLLGVKEDAMFGKDSCSLNDRPSKIPKVVGLDKLPEVKKLNNVVQKLPGVPIDAKGIGGLKNTDSITNQEDLENSTVGSFEEWLNPDIVKDPAEATKINFVKDSSSLEDKSSPRPKDFAYLDDRKPKKAKVEDFSQRSKAEKKNCVEKPSDGAEVEANNHMEKPKDGSSDGNKRKANNHMEKVRDGSSIDNNRKTMLAQNSPRSNDGPSKENSTSKTKKVKALNGFEKVNTKEILEQKVHHDRLNEVTRNLSGVDKSHRENISKHTQSPKELDHDLSNKMRDEKLREHAKSPKELDDDLSNKMRDEKLREHAKVSVGCDDPSKKRFNSNLSEPAESSIALNKAPYSSVDGSEKGPCKEKRSGKMRLPINNSLGEGPIEEKPIGSKSKPTKASIAIHEGLSKKKLDTISACSDYNSCKISEACLDVGKTYEVSRRPNNGKGWFTSNHWENLKNAHDDGRVILLQNLDPEHTSGEVEDILWSAFKEKCTAKMVQRTAFSSPHYGQALVILRTRDAAERVVGKLNDGCLLISNQRVLVGSIVNLPQPTKKRGNFVGHLFTNKIKLQMQREKKDALSTSHFSQPNTLEYELAMEWCLLQSKCDFSWENLNKRQGKELSKCMVELKSDAKNKK
ncbi:OLC1v1028979C2 [Oldenlandia corymbosa var. corymbosa]|uniref:OLC1v1028979C2 n=1 Tax=Oldenlandia corymbosa var. corymbosa TaxID=529605 RepID=A0AAV1CFV1_OLDCO|nr:OLC1v1028979C2 [Oldenlandia corymbosa var. corymbosa]